MNIKILTSQKLTSSEKILLIAINEIATYENRTLTPLSLEELSELTSLSCMHITRLIKTLENRKCLYIDRYGKNRNMYQIIL